MNIIEAAKTRKPMRLKGSLSWIEYDGYMERYRVKDPESGYWYDCNFTEHELLSEDWEVEE